jgi:MFS family permease
MRFGPKATLLPALVLIAAGMLYFARTPVDGEYAIDILPAMIVIGLGTGLAFPSLMMLAMSGATERDAGLASGLVNTTVQVGGAIGLAVLAKLATDRTESLIADGETAASALNAGYHVAYLIGAAPVAVAILVAMTMLRPPARASRALPNQRETDASRE